MCSGGVQTNVVPAEMTATFDFRITPKMGMEDFERMLHGWAEEVGGISFEFTNQNRFQGCTDVEKDPYVNSFMGAIGELGLKTVFEIFPAFTSR